MRKPSKPKSVNQSVNVVGISGFTQNGALVLGYSIQSTNFLLCTYISLILFFNINKIYGNYTVISPRRTITYKFYEL